MPVRKVFLSSSGADLRTYREAAYAALHKLDDWHCIRMEDFGTRDWDVDTFCRNEVKACHLFIGIIGHRFGDGPKETKQSYTQREYKAAVEAKLPRLLFLAPDDFPVPAKPREPEWRSEAQDTFRQAILDSKDRVVSIGFTNPDELATKIVTAIRNWERESTARMEPIRRPTCKPSGKTRVSSPSAASESATNPRISSISTSYTRR
jgi:hypothetical protein